MNPWENDPIVEQPRPVSAGAGGAAPWESDPAVEQAPPQPAAQPQTSIAHQAGSGLNEGIANALGLPVDLVTSVLNMGARAIGAPEITNPVGGSESIKAAMGDTLISPAEPQGAAQRYARRIGQEVGGAAVAGPALGARTAGATAINAASAVGAGIGGQTAREIAPESDLADMAGSLIGGGAAVAGAYRARGRPQAPTNADLKATQRDAYSVVEADGTRLSPGETATLKSGISQALTDAKIHPSRHPKASSMADDLMAMDNPTITELDQWRQVVSRDVAASTDPSERRMGQIIKDQIDGFMDNLSPGTIAKDTLDALHLGRETTQKLKKSEMLDTATTKAQRRAASTGSGGNVINASRQNIRAILDDPRKSRGFSGNEIAAMEGIVRGTKGENALRAVGALAPSKGALGVTSSLIQVAGASSTGNMLFIAPGVVGEIAKRMGENLTDKQISKLSALIRNGGEVDAKTLSQAERSVLETLIALRAAGEEERAPQ